MKSPLLSSQTLPSRETLKVRTAVRAGLGDGDGSTRSSSRSLGGAADPVNQPLSFSGNGNGNWT